MKRILLVLAMATLLGGPAFAASTPRDVHPGLIMSEGPTITLLEYHSAEITTSGHCLNLDGLGVPTTAAQLGIRNSAACDTLTLNQYIFARAAKITNLRVTNTLKGDTSYSCVFTIEVDATATGTTLTTTVDLALGASESQAQNIIIAAGDKVGIMVANGAGCGGTIDPSWNVQLEGQWLK